MLSEKDLIYLGAMILLNGSATRNGIVNITDNGISSAIDISNQVFEKIFREDKCVNKMIVE